jgi:acyl carrier protein
MGLTSETLMDFFEADLGLETSDIAMDTELFSGGLIDSFALVSLMAFIETEEEIRIGASEVTLENLDTVERILNYVERKRALQ